MADDTRIAEACLLLNYSSQSYREQIMISRQEQPTNEADQQSIIQLDSSPNEDAKFNLGSTSPFSMQTSTKAESLDHQEPPVDSGCEVYVEEASHELPSSRAFCNQNQNNYRNSNGGPMSDLLAAVSCALPESRSRPTILQRSPSVRLTKTIHDHDYCQQAQEIPTSPTNPDCDPASANAKITMTEKTPYPARVDSMQLHSCQKKRVETTREDPKQRLKPMKLVAVHLGAGSSQNNEESMQIARAICEEIMLTGSNSIMNLGYKRRRKSALGAGNHESSDRHKECQAYHQSSTDLDAESAVAQLIKRLEDHQALNCGYGSNLNIKGQVECDASLMCDRTQMWAGVGAVSGCRNPILLAKSLYDHRLIPRPLGLIQPNILVGSGARQWMREHCPHLAVVDSKMVSSKSFATYQRLKSRYDQTMKSFNKSDPEPPSLDGCPIDDSHIITPQKLQVNRPHAAINMDHGFYCASTASGLQRVTTFAAPEQVHRVTSHLTPQSHITGIDSSPTLNEERLDTVGAIVVDGDNNFASAISSGGLLLKYKGRVGQAAIPGAGCWAEDSIAVTTTGVGEYLTVNLFARKFYDKMLRLRLIQSLGHVGINSNLSESINDAIRETFNDLTHSPALSHVRTRERLAGMLSAVCMSPRLSSGSSGDRNIFLSYAHNTSSMCVGYMTCNDSVAHSVVSTKLGEKDGQAIVNTIRFALPD